MVDKSSLGAPVVGRVTDTADHAQGVPPSTELPLSNMGSLGCSAAEPWVIEPIDNSPSPRERGGGGPSADGLGEGRGKDRENGENQIDSPCQAIAGWLLG